MFDLDELDAVITNAGGCGSHLKKYAELLHDDPAYRERADEWDRKVRDIHEWLVEIGLRPPRGPGRPGSLKSMTVAYDASCHLLHGQKIARAAACSAASDSRRAARRRCRVRLVLRQRGRLQHHAARAVGETAGPQARPHRRHGAAIVASGNPGCLLQLEMGMRRDPRLRGGARVPSGRVCWPRRIAARLRCRRDRLSGRASSGTQRPPC